MNTKPPPVALNYVCEIGKNTRSKMEVSTGEAMNPIKQDLTKDGKLRFYGEPIPWNYGMLPRTWEDPEHAWSPSVRQLGDGDPLDVVEVGSKRSSTGSIHEVRPLGVLGLLDGGELDWKVIAVRTADPMSSRLRGLADLERELPGEVDAIMRWFRDYKVLDGKPPNRFLFGGKARGAAYAHRVVQAAHEAYLEGLARGSFVDVSSR